MKLSAWVFLTDLVPYKQTFVDKLVKKNIFKKYGYERVFSDLKKSGVDGIELLIPTSVSQEDLYRAKAILGKHNVSVLSVHQPIDFFLNTTLSVVEQLFSTAKYFGAKVIVLHMSTTGNQIFTNRYVSRLHELEKKYGITIGFENSQRYLFSLLKPYTWHPDRFSSLLQKTDFHMTLDIAHLGQVGTDIVSFFTKYHKTIVDIHISDYKTHAFSSTFRPLELIHLPLGKGDLPMKQFLKTLKKYQYSDLVTMEINGDLNELCESAQMIINYTS